MIVSVLSVMAVILYTDQISSQLQNPGRACLFPVLVRLFLFETAKIDFVVSKYLLFILVS